MHFVCAVQVQAGVVAAVGRRRVDHRSVPAVCVEDYRHFVAVVDKGDVRLAAGIQGHIRAGVQAGPVIGFFPASMRRRRTGCSRHRCWSVQAGYVDKIIRPDDHGVVVTPVDGAGYGFCSVIKRPGIGCGKKKQNGRQTGDRSSDAVKHFPSKKNIYKNHAVSVTYRLGAPLLRPPKGETRPSRKFDNQISREQICRMPSDFIHCRMILATLSGFWRITN